MLAIIGGSGLTQLANLTFKHRLAVRTPYGEPSGPLTIGEIAGRELVFLARHGYGHTIPPHQVNYRANIWALHAQGVNEVLSVASVGGIRADMQPGVLAAPDQIIDYTWSRQHTFFDSDLDKVTHAEFTQPYSEALRKLLSSEDVLAAFEKQGAHSQFVTPEELSAKLQNEGGKWMAAAKEAGLKGD